MVQSGLIRLEIGLGNARSLVKVFIVLGSSAIIITRISVNVTHICMHAYTYIY